MLHEDAGASPPGDHQTVIAEVGLARLRISGDDDRRGDVRVVAVGLVIDEPRQRPEIHVGAHDDRAHAERNVVSPSVAGCAWMRLESGSRRPSTGRPWSSTAVPV